MGDRMGVAWLWGTPVVAAALVLGCNDRPNGLPRFPGTPSPVGSSTFSHLTIVGPPSVPPGGTAQFSAMAHSYDGSSRNASSEVVWRSSDQAVLILDSSGLATGLERGKATISAVLEGRTAVKPEVLVLPTGTFRLTGTVTDAGIPVPGARVVVTRGEGTGQTTSTLPDGRFELFGVAGDVEIQVTKEGYLELNRRLEVSSHQASAQFELGLARPRVDIAGTYTLTITAASTCSALPPEARVRTYAARLSQDGPKVQGTLEGAEFYLESYARLNRFSGTVDPALVKFRFAPPWSSYYLPDVVEVLQTDSSSYLTIVGDVLTSGTSDGRSGSLSGVIETLDTRFRRTASCQSTDHRFVLTR